MLVRVAAHSFRIRQAPPVTAFASLQRRAYAKNDKPRRPSSYKPPSHSAQTTRPSPNAPRDSPSVLPGETEFEARASDSSTKDPPPPGPNFQDDPPSGINSGNPVETRENIRIPLHDLSKGIPSTLDAEFADPSSSAKSDPSSVARASGGGRGSGQMPASAYITSVERRRNRMMNWLFASMILGAVTGTVYLGRNWETEEEERKYAGAPSGWGLGLFYNRVKARLGSSLDYFREPAFPKLLPRPPSPEYEKPFTLVLSLEDLLVHSEWSREHGWRMAKRPGVDYFIRYLSQYYELVIFTSVPSMIADPVIRKLDPFHFILPLFREATLYQNGEYIKDLSYLDRPLSKVILMDTNASHAQRQPENAIILPKWTGDPADKELVSFIPFLEYVATMGLEDARAVLKSFQGRHIPTEFSTREAEARKRFDAQLAQERSKRSRRSGVGFLGSALGITTNFPGGGGMGGFGTLPGEQTLSEGLAQGKMLQDQIRERGQRQYEIMEKEIQENGGKYLKQMEEEEKAAKEEQMKAMKSGMTGFFLGGLVGRGEKKEEEEKKVEGAKR